LVAPNRSHLAYTLILYQFVKRTDSIAKVISKIDLSCVKETPRYAYLSGFDPDKTPSKAYFSWFTSMLFGKEADVDDLLSQGLLVRKIFELVFVKTSIELGIIDPHEKVIFDGCKLKSFCKQKYVPDKCCRCSSNGIKPLKCSMCTDPEATKGYDHNLDEYL
jgi:hypothetical protein